MCYAYNTCTFHHDLCRRLFYCVFCVIICRSTMRLIQFTESSDRKCHTVTKHCPHRVHTAILRMVLEAARGLDNTFGLIVFSLLGMSRLLQIMAVLRPPQEVIPFFSYSLQSAFAFLFGVLLFQFDSLIPRKIKKV